MKVLMVININKKFLILGLMLSLIFSITVYAACTDDDGGIDRGERGTCKDDCEIEFIDSCIGDYFVKEYYCEEGVCEYIGLECLDGGCCSDAACSGTGTCSDSDGGYDYDSKGSCSDKCKSYTDSCSNVIDVKEYYCNDKEHCSFTYRSCELHCQQKDYASGSCSDGACVCSDDTPLECSDSDGGIDRGERGTCKDSGGEHTDGCNYYKTTITEYYCSGNECKLTFLDCPNGGCCSDGVCSGTGTCSDSDGGKDYYIGGTCSDKCSDTVFKDKCYARNIREYFCDGNAHCDDIIMDCDGVCKSKGEDNGCCEVDEDGLAYCKCNCEVCTPKTCEDYPGKCGELDSGCDDEKITCECPEGETCVEGECKEDGCIPNCEGKECGSDGCYGSCGSCPPEKPNCRSGKCTERCTNFCHNMDDNGFDPFNPGWCENQEWDRSWGRCFYYTKYDSCNNDILTDWRCRSLKFESKEIDCNEYEIIKPERDYYCTEVLCPSGEYGEKCGFCADRDRICTLESASITPVCSGGVYTECETGEKIIMSADFTNECEIDGNTYLQINAKSLDGTCEIEYSADISGLTQQNPIKSPPCAPGHIDNGDNTCTVIIDNPDLIYDGWAWHCTGNWDKHIDENRIEFGESSSGCNYNGFIEWDISSIPDGAIIIDTVFVYHGASHSSYLKTYIKDIVHRAPSSYGSGKTEVSNLVKDAENGTAYLKESASFPKKDINQRLDLGEEADLQLYRQLKHDWFAIGLTGYKTMKGSYFAEIYSEEAGGATPKPTLEVTYQKFFGTLSGEWEVPTITEACGEKTVYAYSAELWQGEPGIGTLISEVTDSSPLNPSPVDGSFKFSAPVCSADDLEAYITVINLAAEKKPIHLSYTINPPTDKIKVEFEKNPIPAGENGALMRIIFDKATQKELEGVYIIEIRGTGDSITRTTTYTLTVV